MTSVSEVLTFVKQEYRINSTADDTYLVSLINKNYANRSRGFAWKETIQRNASFTTATSTQLYSTSSNFLRLVPESVRYGVTSTSTGNYLPEIPFEQSELYKGAFTGSDPQWATITAGSTSGKAILLFPAFTNSGSVVTYDYYAKPTSLSSTGTLTVPALAETVAYDTLSDWAFHVNNEDGQERYKAMARECWRSAFVEILPDT